MLEVNGRYNEIVEDLRNRNKTKKGNYTTAEIRGIANDILIASDIDIQSYRSSIPIVKISKNFGILSYKEKNICVSGKILVNGTTGKNYGAEQVIIVNEKYNLFLKRFVVAYQLGCFLFKYLGSEYDEEKTFYEEEYQHFVYLPRNNDKQISNFAEEILMPREMFYREYFHASECVGDCLGGMRSIAIRQYLSRYFEVEIELVGKQYTKI